MPNNDKLLNQYSDIEPTDAMDLNLLPTTTPNPLVDWNKNQDFTTEEYTGHLRGEGSRYDEGISYDQAMAPLGFEQYRHEQQGNIAQLGSALNQAIVGEIAGGTIEGLGYLLDIPQYADLIKGTETEFSN